MNFIWLKSHSGAVSDLPVHRKKMIALDFAEDPASVVSEHQCDPIGAIIVEVREPVDLQRAFALVDELHTTYPVWIYQRNATIQSTLSFMKAGASHVMTQPEEIDEAMTSVQETSSPEGPTRKALIGRSRSIQAVSSSISLVANRRCNVLIEGETGTGKEVVAQEIHRSGNRARGPWVAVNCGAIPESLLEAELFGHVRGAFTGAVQARPGKFETANRGSIFLDEIGDMPFAVQAKLLRVLQEKEIERLGGNERIRLDVRVIAATNANLRDKIKEGRFRDDLYYRLNVFHIALPPLREHPADIPVLAQHFIAKICADENVKPKTLDASVLDRLLEHTWPGNARELENVMETAVILSGTRSSVFLSDIRISSDATTLTPHSKQTTRTLLPSGGLDYQQTLETFEHDLLTQALAQTRGNKTAAADLLRLKRTTLSARMRVLESRMPRLVA